MPGSTLVSGDTAGAWVLDLAERKLLRLDETLSLRLATPLPKKVIGDEGSPRLLHLAGFGREGVWLLDPASKRIWRFAKGAWSDPMTIGVSFTGGAARSPREILLNAPKETRPLVLVDEKGTVTARFGQREPPPFDQFAEEYGNWVMAAGRKTWIAAHRFSPDYS
jgi:hypothetical protein